jgi:hypothetical protein
LTFYVGVGISNQHENLMNLEASFTSIHNTKLVSLPKEAVSYKNIHYMTKTKHKRTQLTENQLKANQNELKTNH